MRRLLALFVASALLTTAGAASAYCRSSVCNFEGESVRGKVCEPPEEDDCGVPLAWRVPCVGFTVQEDGSSQVSAETTSALMAAAFFAWTSIDCGGAGPSIVIDDLGEVTCSKIEYNQHAGNANIVIYRDDAWPHEDAAFPGTADTIALTTVTYDVEKGDIYDADVEVNTAENQFSIDGSDNGIDLLSVLTHEAGHFLGLAHSPELEATMTPVYPGGTDLQTPAADDIAGICTIYPIGRSVDGECTSLPRHGYSPSCLSDQTEGNCSIGLGADRPEGSAAMIAIACLFLGLRARSARRARS